MNDATNAETYVNRVAHFMHRTSDKELIMRYKRAQVRVLDSKREFILAAQGYYNLSFQEGLDMEEIADILRLAITCTLLAPAGPRKSRLMTVLFNDIRTKSLQFHGLLQKMFMGEVVKREHVTEFQQSLQTHQNIRYSDGYSVLEKALIEHNIGVLSKIYMNITFVELGNFLGIHKEQAETFVAKMISEQRITAVLDQANELVEFEEEGKQLQTFNAQIQTACEQVDGLMQEILKAHPETQALDTFVF